MLMYLNSVPIFTIILVGRWSSEAFLLYVRKQVLSFTAGISEKMILTEEFYTVPDEARNPGDPAIHGDANCYGSQQNGHTAIQYSRVVAPTIMVWH